MMGELVRCSSVSVKSPRCCGKCKTHPRRNTRVLVRTLHKPRASSSARALSAVSLLGAAVSVRVSLFWSLTLWALHPLVHPLPRSFNKSISRSQTPSLFVSRLRVSELQLCLHCCRLLEPRLLYTAPGCPARRLWGWHRPSFPSPSGSLWLRELPATDRLSCVCVRARVLIIQSVLKLKDASPDASLIVGVFNGERQMRWEAKGGVSTVKKVRGGVWQWPSC